MKWSWWRVGGGHDPAGRGTVEQGDGEGVQRQRVGEDDGVRIDDSPTAMAIQGEPASAHLGNISRQRWTGRQRAQERGRRRRNLLLPLEGVARVVDAAALERLELFRRVLVALRQGRTGWERLGRARERGEGVVGVGQGGERNSVGRSFRRFLGEISERSRVCDAEPVQA